MDTLFRWGKMHCMQKALFVLLSVVLVACRGDILHLLPIGKLRLAMYVLPVGLPFLLHQVRPEKHRSLFRLPRMMVQMSVLLLFFWTAVTVGKRLLFLRSRKML